MTGPSEIQQQRTLSQARLAQVLTISWMAVEVVVAVGAGLAAHSLALTAFGFDSFIELFSSVVVLRRLIGRSPHEVRGSSTPGERAASRLVGFGLYLLIAYIVLAAIIGLLFQVRADASPVGVGLSLAAILVMAVLWRWRLALADRLGSPALQGDAACSVVCLYLAAATLAGLALNGLFGWWWADSIAGLALIAWIRGEAREAMQAAGG